MFVSIGTASIVEPHYVNPCGFFCESTPDAVVTTSTCDLSIAYNEIANENGVVNPLWKSVVQLNNSSDSVAAIVESEKQLESPTEEYWAVIVGGNALYAHHDAEDMYNVLTMASENWDANHIRLLVNESATKANIRDAIRWMANNANTEDTCLFYFSGHGEQSIDDNGDELDGLDESLLTYYNETILDDELEEWIGEVKAEKVVAILEACYCGGVLTVFQIEEVQDRDGFTMDLEKVNCMVFAACQVNEVSYYLQLLKNGIFSYYVVQGLWSVADHNTDGKISIRELYDYSYPKVVGSTETLIDPEVYNPQHPLLWPEDDIADNIYIIKLKAPVPKKISVPVEYSTIQEAIEAAMPGDTIEVATGTYNENIILNKPLTINAPYRDSIIHAANNSLPCVFITVDNTSISGLTCRNGSDGIMLFMSNNSLITGNDVRSNVLGISFYEYSNSNVITSNNISDNMLSIALDESCNNTIEDNNASNNFAGIFLLNYSDSNVISGNNVSSNELGISLGEYSRSNFITYNTISNNFAGIFLLNYSDSNVISGNNVSSNELSIGFQNSSSNNIYLNNFISNNVSSYSENSTNIWNSSEKITYNYKRKRYEKYLGNHWSNYTGSDRNNDGIGDTPYNIDADSDNYPLMASFEDFLIVETIFDTGASANPYPSIMGRHEGKIKPSCDIEVSKLYTYPCVGTGGHTRSIKIYENGDLKASGNWSGYQHDWQKITITPSVTLRKGREYRYVIETGSYPQIIHVPEYKDATGGTITCDVFTDANGRTYDNWIPAIKLWS